MYYSGSPTFTGFPIPKTFDGWENTTGFAFWNLNRKMFVLKMAIGRKCFHFLIALFQHKARQLRIKHFKN